MPRWARFLSCGLSGLLLSLTGFLLVAYWREGTPTYWRGLLQFITTPEFWSLVWLVALLTGIGLLLGRVLVRLYPVAAGLAGFLVGGVMAFCYVAFLLASRLEEWGGLAASWARIWPSALWLALPFGLAGAFANWLWEQLE